MHVQPNRKEIIANSIKNAIIKRFYSNKTRIKKW